jgi:hypothetical protein
MESNKADAIVRQPFEMRTMFFEMHLLNDASQMHDTSFIQNGKEWGEGKTERERERVKSERPGVWLRKGCGMGHKLDRWSSIYEGLKKG